MENSSVEIDKTSDLNGNQNDVVSSRQIFSYTNTETPSTVASEITEKRETIISTTATTNAKSGEESAGNNDLNLISGNNNVSNDSSAISDMIDKEISSTSINGDKFFDALNNKNINNNNNKSNNNNRNVNPKNHKNCKRYNRSNSNYSTNSSCNNQNRIKKRTRRGKSKRQSNKPYKKTGFKFLRPKSCPNGRLNLFTNQPQVPYNTNNYLMEFHAPEMNMTPNRTRNSSLSVESDDNYFYSLPEDDVDFITKEFSNVYENARCESLEELTKNQLIQQYVNLEAKLDQASLRDKAKDDKIKALEKAISQLTAENNDLRRKLDLKSGCQMMDSDDSDSDSSSSSCSSSSSSTSCSSRAGPDEMMDSDDDIQIQPLTNGVVQTEAQIIVDQNGATSDEDQIYRSPTLSPTFAPISSC